MLRKSSQTTSRETAGRDTYMRCCDIVARDTAKEIREDTRRLQAVLPPGSDEPPYLMKHPDLPGSEDLLVIQVNVLCGLSLNPKP